ncbi:glycoside hydrolase family 71 protein [Aspergillus puulaauensis]|uniref:Glucan endo-1,3-alpha-glucosidase agn1 n=1 Tax=Aspergillus puulaauensis TaxID=1220207 RepID=A0A7R7XZQ8_9EURO|nr:uncharacterized protein APUU_81008A [Aspergillus puulaauensis]BCS30705.1 hypothetical protein APUU_81008A [Aspergillus puulaauensis]
MSLPLQLAFFTALGLSMVDAQAVFAHYMVQSIDGSTDHAYQDIQSAMAVGFEAFALNLGSTADWVDDTVSQLFKQAEGTDFKLFLSFDMYQNSDLDQHIPLFQQYQDHPNYYRAGPDNFPVVSSYGGYNESDAWGSFKSNTPVYLLLNLDDNYAGQGDSSPYFTDPRGQLSNFNDIVDGYFSWESTWPASNNGPANVSADGDVTLIEFSHNARKDYMMGISPLQYKNLQGSTWYRVGEVNLPRRMTQILEIKPDFAEFITWNDAGESHYIGNVWEDGYDPTILTYANNDQWPHYAWQPLVTSFINAYKSGVTADRMQPPADDPIGVMWYRGMLKHCVDNPPRNADAALDAVNFAIVLPSSSEGMQAQVSSGGNVLTTIQLHPGLNYAAVTDMVVGNQTVNLLDTDGNVVMGASSTSEVTDDSECNFNYYVVGLTK